MRDLYFHQGHTWVEVLSFEVVVGVDSFTQKFLGPIDRIECARLGTQLSKGDPIWTLYFSDRYLVQMSPVSGVIVQINRRLEENPRLLNESPCDEGWVLKILPVSLWPELKELCHPQNPMIWNHMTKESVIRHFIPDSLSTHQIYADGGELIPGVARRLKREEWEQVAKSIFHVRQELAEPREKQNEHDHA